MLSHMIVWRYFLEMTKPSAKPSFMGHSGAESVAFRKRMALLRSISNLFSGVRLASQKAQKNGKNA
jgi:hypothetical protein